ncbi:MAG: peptidyl-prolyl cis-trans isomerase [Planctomycetota bacterium]|nr:MAG: peptidyl-prolyl cis-trans isomerase [Planctomycetota bacterium]REJ97399.1 MAG: peptidyl-prolyl cis-trans isomerase [Planctomycetota bacterium]
MEALAMRLNFLRRSTTWLIPAILLAGCSAESEPLPSAAIGKGTSGSTAPAAQRQAVEFVNDYPVVAITTNYGVITVKLDALKAPVTVNNFLWSATHGDYDGTVFHQVQRDYVAVAGEYDARLTRRAVTNTIRNEADNGLANVKGTIAMTRDPNVIDSSTGPFFLNLVDNPHLDHQSADSAAEFGYCVFGSVVEGMDVVEQIAAADVAARGDLEHVPVKAVVIEKMKRIR